jgi:SAM-dependent methyltransferase
MLDRTMDAARDRGVADQVEPSLADVGDLPYGDGEFDLVVSFTGLHCFPDPHRAVLEMGRVTHAGGVLTGSALLNDTGDLRTLAVRGLGRIYGLLGPSATRSEVTRWMDEAGFTDVTLKVSGAIAYFRGVKA